MNTFNKHAIRDHSGSAKVVDQEHDDNDDINSIKILKRKNFAVDYGTFSVETSCQKVLKLNSERQAIYMALSVDCGPLKLQLSHKTMSDPCTQYMVYSTLIISTSCAQRYPSKPIHIRLLWITSSNFTANHMMLNLSMLLTRLQATTCYYSSSKLCKTLSCIKMATTLNPPRIFCSRSSELMFTYAAI